MKNIFSIHPLTLLTFILSLFTEYKSHYFTLYLCIFLHELMHLITALLLGEKCGKIHLFPWGCMLSLESFPSKIKSILIFLSGPIFNLLMYFYNVFPRENLILATFNLLPIPPLDGGMILSVLFPSGSFVVSVIAVIVLFVLCFLYKTNPLLPLILSFVIILTSRHKIEKSINSRVISHFFVEKKAEKLYNKIDKV